ncbi:hypothetical protein Q2T40_12600 [Winogradskyella maritima]|uniref:Nucleic acid binding protein n=1 Tax=Winogradskyella maritima TaxID=1517766 RepID=A0ABV8AID1_9FLAO|nr:hypothetical protein [Winogradskyella maritima]
MKRKWLILLIAILVGSYFAYNYIYQDHRDISEEDPIASVEIRDIYSLFKMDIATAEEKYLDKTIVITGKVSELNTTDLTLDNKAFCTFNNAFKTQLSVDQNVSVKGRCIGYDDLLDLIKLDQCTVVTP